MRKPTVLSGLLDQAGELSRQAAQLEGHIEQLARDGAAQSEGLRDLSDQIDRMIGATRDIDHAAAAGRDRAEDARRAVNRAGEGVADVAHSLGQVTSAADEITRLALQTRLVAFHAAVEARRAGAAGHGFAVVADAVRDLTSKVEQSSRLITATVSQLDLRVAQLAREITGAEEGARSEFQRALLAAERSLGDLAHAARHSLSMALDTGGQMRDRARQALDVHRGLTELRQGVLKLRTVADGIAEQAADGDVPGG
jgi:methyl-accepting chemotaxis protein